jgi:hypothetical protein
MKYDLETLKKINVSELIRIFERIIIISYIINIVIVILATICLLISDCIFRDVCIVFTVELTAASLVIEVLGQKLNKEAKRRIAEFERKESHDPIIVH